MNFPKTLSGLQMSTLRTGTFTRQLLLLALFTLFPFTANAAPKTDENCVACVTQKQRAMVQKKLDDLRSKVKRLEEENKVLKNRPVAIGTLPVSTPRTLVKEVPAPRKKHRVAIAAGTGPTSLTNRRKERSQGTEIAITRGPILGGQYQYSFTESVNAGLQVTTPTRPDNKEISVLGLLGFDF